jgi:phosphohistidine phosphatase
MEGQDGREQGHPSSVRPSGLPRERRTGQDDVMIRGTQRRLVLVRHAKSSRPEGVPDHERPLAGKGRRHAHAAGKWFVDEGPRPELALVSSAVRAQQTWEILCGTALGDVPTRYDDRLYDAGVKDVLRLVSVAPDVLGTLVVVGHEPTMSRTALALAGPGSDRRALDAVRQKFPNGAVAVLRFTGPWRSLRPGGAVLESFAVPRD